MIMKKYGIRHDLTANIKARYQSQSFRCMWLWLMKGKHLNGWMVSGQNRTKTRMLRVWLFSLLWSLTGSCDETDCERWEKWNWKWIETDVWKFCTQNYMIICLYNKSWVFDESTHLLVWSYGVCQLLNLYIIFAKWYLSGNIGI